jgi:hypothetical protein
MFRNEALYRLDLADQYSLHKQVSVVNAHDSFLIDDVDRRFLLGGQARIAKVVSEGIDVDLLQKAPSELLVNFVRTANDSPCQLHELERCICVFLKGHNL